MFVTTFSGTVVAIAFDGSKMSNRMIISFNYMSRFSIQIEMLNVKCVCYYYYYYYLVRMLCVVCGYFFGF